jgi:hypothetical protein
MTDNYKSEIILLFVHQGAAGGAAGIKNNVRLMTLWMKI